MDFLRKTSILFLLPLFGTLSCTPIFYNIPQSSIILSLSAPSAPTNWSLSSPSNGSTSADPTPLITGAAGSATATSIIKVWVNDSACTVGTEIGSGTVANDGSFTIHGDGVASAVTLSTDGLKTFYYTIEDTIGTTSSCTTPTGGLSYTYQTNPIFNLNSTAYVVREDGTLLNSAFTVTRDVSGIASVVTVTSSDVSALTGSDYTASTITLNFNATDTTKTVSAASFTIADDANVEGDEYFKIKLGVTSGGVVGTNKQAMVTIVDNEATGDTGDFMFTQPLFTANDTSANASLTVIRTGSNATLATVDVSFVDASAGTGIDYTGTTQTLTFAASGAIEQTVNVPIFGVSSNRSFIAKLTNPSTGKKVRSLSVAKVRILDVGNATVCDSTNDNTGTNAGFGGGAGTVGNPYLICSLTQLYRVRNNLTSSFKMMSDIDADPSLDADSGTAGVQPYTPITGIFTGNFDGNERTISNYTYTGSGAADNNKGFFSYANSPSSGGTTIKNVNMLYASVTNTGDYSGILISNAGSGAAYVPVLSRNLVSGYLNPLGSSAGMIAAYVRHQASANEGTAVQSCISHGKIVAATTKNYFGGIIGQISGNQLTPTYSFQDLYNTANFVGTGSASYAGGIIGYWTHTVDTTTAVDAFTGDIENRGLMSAAALSNYMGGIIGQITGTLGITLGTTTTNYGPMISTGSFVGGIVGSILTSASTGYRSIDNATNYGTIDVSSYGAGILGYGTLSAAGPSISITNSTNYATVTSGIAGGIVSRVDHSGSNTTLTLSGNTNNGVIAGGSGKSAGIIGYIVGSGANTSLLEDISYNTNTAQVNSTCGCWAYGGIVGMISWGATGSDNIVNVNDNSNTAYVYAQAYVGGIVGEITSSSPSVLDGNSFFISNNTNSGMTNAYMPSFAGNGRLGGIVGYIIADAKSKFSILSNTNSGTLNNTAHHQGGIVGSIVANSGNSSSTIEILGNTNNGAITTGNGGYNALGGVVGFADVTDFIFNVKNNVNTGVFTLLNASNVGGLIGYINTKGAATVDIGGTGSSGATPATWSYSTSNINAGNGIGGLVGGHYSQGNSSLTVHYAYNTGSITSSGINAGGLIGKWDLGSATATNTIDRCYSTGSISATTAAVGKNAGGLVGYIGTSTTANINAYASIHDSFSQGASITTAIGGAGGFIGTVENSATYTLGVDWKTSYVTSTISMTSGNCITSNTCGGIIGDKSLLAGNLIIGDSSLYKADGGNTGLGWVGGQGNDGEGAGDADMAMSGNNPLYSGAGFDIGNIVSPPSTIWLNPGVNGVYPSLSGY